MSPRPRSGSAAGRAAGLACAALAGAMVLARAPGAAPARATSTPAQASAPIVLPENSERIAFENLEGAMLVRVVLGYSGGRDTSGTIVLDTGAGYLALSPALIRAMDLSDSLLEELNFAPRALRRLRIGGMTQDVVAPVLSVDTDVIRRVTDRDILGLLGQSPLSSFALWIDYQRDSLALIPIARDGVSAQPTRRGTAVDMAAAGASFGLARQASKRALGGALSENAIPSPFRLEGDGKILVRVRVANPTPPAMTGDLNLVLDTGATKSVLFEDVAAAKVAGLNRWKRLRGLSAPTLYGAEEAFMARVPEVALTSPAGKASALDVDFAVIRGELGTALTRAVGTPVDGLLGYSFLRRFRVTVDYPHRVLWLDPVAVERDQRRFEYSHVGVQIERRDGALVVVAVAEGSPAAAAGVRVDDVLVAIDGTPAATFDVTQASRRMEGAPGTRTTIVIKRGAREQTYRLVRRQLL